MDLEALLKPAEKQIISLTFRGQKIYMRTLMGDDVLPYYKYLGDKGLTENNYYMAAKIAACLCDEQGNVLFGPESIPDIKSNWTMAERELMVRKLIESGNTIDEEEEKKELPPTDSTD